jgi:ABC-type thiamin/hydroxymethylpyrimidine transport system permease subunit
LLRQVWYGKHLGELQAHQISTLTGVVLFGVYIGFIVRVWRPESATQAMAVGLLWLAMTVAFEFLFGHYVAGHPWDRLLHDYNLFAGRVWVVVLVWVTVAPYLFFRLRG